MVRGLRSSDLGPPDYGTAMIQHAAYVQALRECGLDIIALEPDDDYPDSTFVEDTALVAAGFAVMMRPGAPSRRGETEAIKHALSEFYDSVEELVPPGTADAGDIMMLEEHFFIGLSQRTNADGADQIIRILKAHGLTASTIPLKDVLHLKSGVAYVGNGTLVASGEFIGRPEFAGYRVIPVGDDERYAANCLGLNGKVLIASGYPKTRQAIQSSGYETIPLAMSEFQKLDGGLSCLSLRF
jgi:dimethylargininase